MLAIWTAAHSDGLLRTFHFAWPCVRMAIGSEVMPNTGKILIVDDDPQLRDALTEQLSLHEEFEAAAAENGTKGVQVAKETPSMVPVLFMPPSWPWSRSA